MEGTRHKEKHCVCLSVSVEFRGIVLFLDCFLVLAFSFFRAMQSPCIQSYDYCIKLQGTQWL